MPDAAELFHVLQLVLYTQLRSNPVGLGANCEQLIFVLRRIIATMNPMTSAYGQLLEATIQHLEDLKSRGIRHVAIAPETLRALAQPAPRPAAPPQELRSSRREEAQTFLETIISLMDLDAGSSPHRTQIKPPPEF